MQRDIKIYARLPFRNYVWVHLFPHLSMMFIALPIWDPELLKNTRHFRLSLDCLLPWMTSTQAFQF